MPASPLSKTTDKNAAEDAAQDTLNFVTAKARALGRRPSVNDVASGIYGLHTTRQARSLLFDALCLSYGVKQLDMTKIFHSLRAYDRASAYDYGGMIDMLEIVEDTTREMARDCRERMGNAA